MSICQKFILKESLDCVLMANYSLNQHIPTYFFVPSSLSTTESIAPFYFDIQYGNDFQFYRNFFQYISPIIEPKQNIRQINQNNENAAQPVMLEKPLKRIEKKKQGKKQIHLCQQNSFKKTIRRNIYKKDQDRNILPNAISKIFFFLRSKKKSKNLVQKILQTNIKKTNQMSSNKYYTYQNLIRSKLSRYMTVQALEQLFSLVDPSFKIFSFQQQLTFIKLNGILLRIFIRSYLNIQGMVNHASKGSNRIKIHLQKYRIIGKKVEQQIQKFNGSLMFNKSQQNSYKNEPKNEFVFEQFIIMFREKIELIEQFLKQKNIQVMPTIQQSFFAQSAIFFNWQSLLTACVFQLNLIFKSQINLIEIMINIQLLLKNQSNYEMAPNHGFFISFIFPRSVLINQQTLDLIISSNIYQQRLHYLYQNQRNNIQQMDLDYLQQLLAKIDLKPQSISSIAQYCILNSRGSEAQISKVIQRSFPGHYNEKMMAILQLVSQILVRTGDRKDERFFKPLAPKAKVYIEEISRRVREIKPEHIKRVPEILARWSRAGKEIFSPGFMQKLRRTADPIIVAANKYQQQKRNNLFENYSKTFLMEYEDVKSYEPTSRIYEDYIAFEKISVQIGQINTEMKKLGLEKMTPEMCLRAVELRKKLEKFSEKLQDIICKYHVDFKILREAAKQQFDKLPQEAKQILDKSKQ